MADNDQDQDVGIEDDGSEGSTMGYMTPDQLELKPDSSYVSKTSREADESDDDDSDGNDDRGDEGQDDDDDDKGTPDKLEAREKELQKAYTTKFRELSKKRGMIDMMERIQANPKEMIPWLAEQYGVELTAKSTSKDTKTEIKPVDLSGITPEKDESMPAYINRAFSTGLKGLMEQLPGMIKDAVQGIAPKAQRTNPMDSGGDPNDAIQRALKHMDEKYDDWPLYEDEMIAELKKDHSLINDPDKLYEAGKKVSTLGKITSKKAAKTKKESKRFSTGMRGTGKRQTSKKGGIMNFNDSWEQAKADVNRRRR